MKFNAKYQLGKGLAFLGLATLTFAGCEKPDPEPTPTPQPNQKTEEFVYDENLSFNRPNSAQTINYTAFADTVAKLAANGAVKTIHITPKSSHMLETLNETKVLTRTNILDNMHHEYPYKPDLLLKLKESLKKKNFFFSDDIHFLTRNFK